MNRRFELPIRSAMNCNAQLIAAYWHTARAGLFVGVVVLMVSPLAVAAAQSAQPEQPKWRTGNELDKHLQTSLSVSWNERELHDCLSNFSEQQQIAIWIDRRVDPSMALTYQATNVTFEQILWEAAKQSLKESSSANHKWSDDASELGVCRLDDFYYVGPSETAAVLPLLWSRLKSETTDIKSRSQVRWHQRDKLHLPMLTNPAEALLRLTEQNEFQLLGENLPHDCWRQQRLPSVSLDQQVAMLTIGFGKWFERSTDGQKIQLINIPQFEIERMKFNLSERTVIDLARLKSAFPDCKLTATRSSLTATGTPEQLAAIQSVIVRSQRPLPVSASDEKQFTLTTSAARGSILATIAQQTGNQLKFDPSLNATLQQIIDLKVQQVSLNDLIERALEGTGAGYRIAEGKLEIFVP